MERNKFKNYKGISLLSVVGKIYGGILVNRICRVIERLVMNTWLQFREGVCKSNLHTSKQVKKHKRKYERCIWALWIRKSCMIGLIGKLYGRY